MEQSIRRLRPLALGEIIDTAIALVRRRFRDVLLAVGAVMVPATVLALVVLLVSPDGTAELAVGTGDPEDEIEGSAVLAVMLFWFLTAFASLLATAAVYRLCSEDYLGVAVDWRSSISFAWGRALSVIWLTVLFSLGLTVAFLCLVIPGIWLMVAWALSIPVLLSEGVKGSKALGRSYRLVRGRWWPTAGTLFLAFLLVGVLQFAVGLLVGLALGAAESSETFEAITTSLVNLLVTLVSIPFTTAVLMLVYFDLRVRKEGIDISLAAGLEGEASPAQAGVPRYDPPPPPPPPPPPTAPGTPAA